MACTPVAKSHQRAGEEERFCFQEKVPPHWLPVHARSIQSAKNPKTVSNIFARWRKQSLPSLDQQSPFSLGVLTTPIPCYRVQPCFWSFGNVDNFGLVACNSATCQGFFKVSMPDYCNQSN